jgi:hypothetical protein
MIKPSKKKSEYETNDVIISLQQPTDNCNGRLDLPIVLHCHWWNRPNPDVTIKNVKIQPTCTLFKNKILTFAPYYGR